MDKTASQFRPRHALLTRLPSEPRVRERKVDSYYCLMNAAPVAGLLLVVWFLLAYMLPMPDASVWNSVEFVNARYSRPVPAALRDDAIIVGISASGIIYYGLTYIPTSGLKNRIQKSLQVGSEKRIYLNVDSRAHYKDVKAVLPQIASVGIENITFITR
jgi:biopolymer transport protein ExbD